MTGRRAGRRSHYTATAGNLLLRDEQDKANASIFYVAYTQDGADAQKPAGDVLL